MPMTTHKQSPQQTHPLRCHHDIDPRRHMPHHVAKGCRARQHAPSQRFVHSVASHIVSLFVVWPSLHAVTRQQRLAFVVVVLVVVEWRFAGLGK